MLNIQQNETVQLLKAFRYILLNPEEINVSNTIPTSLPTFLPCDKCKEDLARNLPCDHNLCENCIKEHFTNEFIFTCPICFLKLKGVPEVSGFFVTHYGVKSDGGIDESTRIEVKIFSNDDIFLNFQFLSDFANYSKKSVDEDNFLQKYFSVLKNLTSHTSEVSLTYKKLIFLYSFPISIERIPENQFKQTRNPTILKNLHNELKSILLNRSILVNDNGRTNKPIIITKSFTEYKNICFNFGNNLLLVNKLLQRLYSAEPRDFLSNANGYIPVEKECVLKESEQLPPEPDLPLKSKYSARFSYKSLVGSLYQAPCNEFEEKLINNQKYEDFKNPIFSLNNDLITQAKEIAGSLTSNASSSIDFLPDHYNFSFDLYQQIKCNKYRYCGQCRPNLNKDVYSPSVSEISESDQKAIAAYECIECKKYLCPTCANNHKIENMDHRYKFRIDRKDYEIIKRQRQDDVTKSMHELIKKKVKNVLEKVNDDVFAHLKSCIDGSEGKYSANN